MNELITILLATYNGEQYIEEQLQSLFNQTYTEWQLIIRDDHSTDNTPAILNKYQQQYPDKITILPNEGKNLGSILNFNALLQFARTAKYIMFCDQDDRWLPDKIAVTFAKVQALEQEFGSNYPIMVFTNFQYVDEQMNVIEAKKDFEINTIKNFGYPHLLAQNPVYGCTSIINKALADVIKTIPAQAENHDHWIALVAAAFGKLYYYNVKPILYRQHGSNISGSFDNDTLQKRIKRIFVNKKNFKDAKRKYAMLQIFRERYYNKLNKQQQETLDDFLRLYTDKNPLYIIKSLKNEVHSQTKAQTFLLYLTIFFTKSELGYQ